MLPAIGSLRFPQRFPDEEPEPAPPDLNTPPPDLNAPPDLNRPPDPPLDRKRSMPPAPDFFAPFVPKLGLIQPFAPDAFLSPLAVPTIIGIIFDAYDFGLDSINPQPALPLYDFTLLQDYTSTSNEVFVPTNPSAPSGPSGPS